METLLYSWISGQIETDIRLFFFTREIMQEKEIANIPVGIKGETVFASNNLLYRGFKESMKTFVIMVSIRLRNIR